MVVGVFAGIIFEKLIKMNDLLLLAIHNAIFGLLLMGTFFAVTFGAPYIVVLLLVLLIGLMYAWNTSVARGCISKLIPKEKASEFMGYYSTFTYLGISVVSGIDTILHYFHLPYQALLIVLFVWLLPAYLFLILLHRATLLTSATNFTQQQAFNAKQ